MHHRRLLALPLLVALALAAACQAVPAPAPAGTPPTVATPAAGSTVQPTPAPRAALASEISLGMVSINDSFEPHVDASLATRIPLRNTFDGLTSRDTQGALIPALAESWRSVDPTTWEFRLRQGVKFHDGTPMTAGDVVFTIERILNPEERIAIRDRLTTINGVSAPDPQTIRITTSAPDGLLPGRVAVANVVPAARFQQLGAGPFAQAPIGTGRYRVQEFRPNQGVVFEAFADAWQGAPIMPRARIVRVPEAASLVAAIRTGEIDMAYDIPADAVAQVTAQPELRVEIFTRTAGTIIDLNLLEFPEQWGDRRVRQAVNYAVDKAAVNRAALNGAGTLSDAQFVPRGVTGYNPSVQAYPYDLARARVLMQEAGKTAGFSTVVLTIPGPNSVAAEAVSGFLAPLNIRMEINRQEFATYLQTYLGGRKGPMFLWAPDYSAVMDADAPLTFFMSTAAPNIRRMENAEITRLVAQSKSELDQDRRAQLLQQAGALLREEAPVIWLYFAGNPVAVNRKVENLERRVDNVIYLADLARIR